MKFDCPRNNLTPISSGSKSNDGVSFDYQSSKVDGVSENSLPATIRGDNIAFAEISHAGIRNGSLFGSAPILIIGYNSDNPVFYVDNSATFNFTNALKFTASDGIIELRLPNHECSGCLAVYRLQRADYASEEDKRITASFMTNAYMAKQNELIDPDYWYKIQQIEKENEMNWDNLMVSQAEAERFSINGYPTYLLFNTEGRLLEYGNRLQVIYDFLNRQ